MDARARIEALAAEAGFDRVRFAGAEALEEARAAARAARAEGRLADLRWMTDGWIDRAADPDAFLAGARTVALFAAAAHDRHERCRIRRRSSAQRRSRIKIIPSMRPLIRFHRWGAGTSKDSKNVFS